MDAGPGADSPPRPRSAGAAAGSPSTTSPPTLLPTAPVVVG